MLSVLFLAANPVDRQYLGLKDEYKKIVNAWQSSNFKEYIDCRSWFATSKDDIHDLLRFFKPDIVHFSGHGSKLNNLIFEDSVNLSDPVNKEAFSDVLKVLGGNLKCVFLNACYSDEQAKMIAQSVGCAIGTKDEIDDVVATRFSQEFYKELFDGAKVQKAFDSAKSKLAIKGDTQALVEMQVLNNSIREKVLLEETEKGEEHMIKDIEMYVMSSYKSDEFAKLDQAGNPRTITISLPAIFVDVDLIPREAPYQSYWAPSIPSLQELLEGDKKRVVIIGGPGQGKSTLGQLLCQKYRAYYLNIDESKINEKYKPKTKRIPYRIELRYYAQSIVDHEGNYTVERFLADRMREKTNKDSLDAEYIEKIFTKYPTLVVLDGLDEVMDVTTRRKMIDEIRQFTARCNTRYKSDVQIIATSRPTGYSSEFEKFKIYDIAPLTAEKIVEYTEKWINTNKLEQYRAESLREGIQKNLDNPLLKTPLQATIFILIILDRGEVPKQREAFFDEYLDVIYKREASKSTKSLVLMNVDKEVLLKIHRYIGFVLHRDAERSQATESVIAKQEFHTEVLKFLKRLFMQSEELETTAEQIVTASQERLVLLVEPKQGFFGFEIRSFQEFFAAQYLAQTANDSDQKIERFKAISFSPHWTNVALFFAGWINRRDDGLVDKIVNVCKILDREGIDIYLKRGAKLALSLASDHCFSYTGASMKTSIHQYNLLEYALSILENDISTDETAEIILNIKNLTPDEIDSVVVPLLKKKIEKLDLPSDINTFDCFASVVNSNSLIQGVITKELGKNKQNTLLLLKRSLTLGLSAEFITETFSKVIEQYGFGEIMNELGDVLVRLICQISLDQIKSPIVITLKSVFPKILDKLLENPRRYLIPFLNYDRGFEHVGVESNEFEILESISGRPVENLDILDQKLLALRCFCDVFKTEGRYYSSYRDVVKEESLVVFKDQRIKELIPEFYTAILSAWREAVKVLINGILTQNIEIDASKDIIQYIKNELIRIKQEIVSLSTVTKYLSRIYMPIESFFDNTDYLIELSQHRIPTWSDELESLSLKYSYYYQILYRLGPLETEKIMDPIIRPELKPEFKDKDLISGIHSVLRHSSYWYYQGTISLGFALKVLQKIRTLPIENNGKSDAVYIFEKLLWLTWDYANTHEKKMVPSLISEITEFTNLLAKKRQILRLIQLPIALSKLSKEFEPVLKLIFKLFSHYQINDNTLYDLMFYLRSDLNKEDIQSLLDLYLKGNTEISKGFLKWFALVNLQGKIVNIDTKTYYQEGMKIESDKEVIRLYLSDEDVFARMGAIFVLSNSKGITIRNILKFLPNDKPMSIVEKSVWSYLFLNKVSSSESKAKIEVVLSILSSNIYPKFLKKLSRESLDVVHKSLYEQQIELGLPFN